jgi:hypothetical protein
MLYCDTKLEWSRDTFTVCCTRNERSGKAWFKVGIETEGQGLAARKEDALYVERKKIL